MKIKVSSPTDCPLCTHYTTLGYGWCSIQRLVCYCVNHPEDYSINIPIPEDCPLLTSTIKVVLTDNE